MYPEDYSSLQKSITNIYEFIKLDNPDSLYPYQEFVRRFMGWHTPYTKLILIWPVGSGKSFAMISPAVANYISYKIKCIVVTKGDSGTASFKKQVLEYKKYCRDEFNEDEIFTYIHYMSLTNRIKNTLKKDMVEYIRDRLYIFDEIHHIQEGVNLETIRNIILESKRCKFIFATATPMINSSNQIKSLQWMLGSLEGIVSYNSLIKNKPRVVYEGNNTDVTTFPIYISEMISHQRKYYLEKISEDSCGELRDIYLAQTHISLFVTPDKRYGSTIRRMKDKTTKKIFDVPELEQHYIPFVETKRSITLYMQNTKNLTELIYKKYDIVDKYRKYLKGDGLRECGAKYYTLMNIIEKENLTSPILIFLPQVHGSGLYLLCNILEEHGYSLYQGEQISRIHKKKRYTFCTGDQSHSHNFDKIDGFNSEENKYGEYVRIIIGSNVIAESITLFNVRQFHALTPHWNISVLDQAIGRVVRNNSHSQLPPKQREVKIYLHASAINGDIFDNCVDIKKFQICNKKQEDISRMEDWLKEIAIDRYIGEPIKNIEEIDYRSFIIYQIHKYFNKYYEDIKKMYFPCSLEKIVNTLNVHESIVLECLAQIITNNMEINENRYLREDLNFNFFTTSIIELPFVTMNPNVLLSSKEKDLQESRSHDNFRIFNSNIDFFNYIKSINFKEKVLYLEYLIKENKSSLYSFFDSLFFKEERDGESAIYHIMNYCLKDTSYTASHPIPKIKDLALKTRVLYPTSWTYQDIEIPFDIDIANIEQYEYLLFVQSPSSTYDRKESLNTESEAHKYYIFDIKKEEDISYYHKRKWIKEYYLKRKYGESFLIYSLFNTFKIYQGSLSEIVYFFKKLNLYKYRKWRNIDSSIKEEEIIIFMINKFEMIDSIISQNHFFLILSCNDDEFRIKIRNEDSLHSDKRKQLRGRTLKSMKKTKLNLLYREIIDIFNLKYIPLTKLKEIIDRIQIIMIENNKVLIY